MSSRLRERHGTQCYWTFTNQIHLEISDPNSKIHCPSFGALWLRLIYEQRLMVYTRLSTEIVQSPLSYTPTRCAKLPSWANNFAPTYINRDISQLGVVFVQMLLGLDAVLRYPTPSVAVNSCELYGFTRKDVLICGGSANFPETLRDLTIAMLEAGKRRVTSCIGLLNQLPAVATSTKSANITITSPSVLTLPGGFRSGRSPELDSGPLSAYRPHHSRWREDWEELEVRRRASTVATPKIHKSLSCILAPGSGWLRPCGYGICA